jgi:glycosyltransferase involved in cell wall biosynthesis
MKEQRKVTVVEQTGIGDTLSNIVSERPDMALPSLSESLIQSPPPSLRGKRAAMVTFAPYPDEPRTRRAVDTLLKEGMSVDLICRAQGGAPSREKSNGINILRLTVTHRRDSKLAYVYNYSVFILTCASLLALRSLKRRYDLVYVINMPDILVLTSLVPKMLGAKVVLDMRDPMPELMTTIFNLDKTSLVVRAIQRLEKWSMARAHLVVAVNVACKRIFASRSCGPDKIGVVMNSPDEKIFPLRPPLSYSSASGVPEKHFVVMYHGSSVKRNGLDLAVDALAEVRKHVPAAELRIYSRKTPFVEKVMDSARKQGLGHCVHFLGPRSLEDLVREIETCDVGIISNHKNAFTEINTPTRIFEYLTMGKPVIAPRTAGVQDYFPPDSLVFFEPGNANELAQRILEVAFHYSEAVERAGRGQDVYLSHTWSQERRALVNLVDVLLERKPTGRVQRECGRYK